MGDIYQFSQSSLELVKKCNSVANRPLKKWMELFKPVCTDTSLQPAEIIVVENKDTNETTILETGNLNTPQPDLEKLAVEESCKRIGAILETESINKLDCLIKQRDYEKILPELANSLPLDCVRKICDEILINYSLYKNIVLHFFPAVIKSENLSIALELLIKGYEIYPDEIIEVIQSVFMNTDVPSKHVKEFLIALKSPHVQSQFILSILETELPSKVFIHHLNTICFLYNNCLKTSEVQNFILKLLMQNSQECQDDKSYGRLLHAFFQNLSSTNIQTIRLSLELLLNMHKTPLVKRCQAIFNNLTKRQ